jgi:K(+)-stimulated pyrophosphate-energized sodium pump
MNPVIKFTTLFGLLAVELAEKLGAEHGVAWRHVPAGIFLVISMVFVWRSFYGMRIQTGAAAEKAAEGNAYRSNAA